MQYNHLLHWFPCKSQGNIAYRIFNVLFLIIRMSPICLQSKQGLRVCALYLTKIDVNKINLTQTKTGMCRIRFTPSPSSPLNLLSSHLLPFLIIFSFTSPLLVSLPRFIYTLYFIDRAPRHHLRYKNKSLQERKASGVETKQVQPTTSSVSLSNLKLKLPLVSQTIKFCTKLCLEKKCEILNQQEISPIIKSTSTIALTDIWGGNRMENVKSSNFEC